MRSPKLQEESSLLASVCSLVGALPQAGAPSNRQAMANLSRGELLCQAFVACCEQCGGLIVADRIALRARHCPHCANRAD
ncbi:MAG TPA: hypothetical protein VGV09_03975 [Steroidobacteraceae bacterium]|nr:hypothetical protein [Steroidobacteraceae bacterium]